MPVFENTAPSTQYLKKLSSTTKAPNEVCSILTLRHCISFLYICRIFTFDLEYTFCQLYYAIWITKANLES